MTRSFRLFAEPSHFWSMNDYAAVVDAVERFKPKRVLEFGPGSSTLALIEGGAELIDCLEDRPDWFDVYLERLGQRFPSVVMMRKYSIVGDGPTSRILCDGVNRRLYDFALIDGPFETNKRPASTRFALERSSVVMAATEDHGRKETSILRPEYDRLATEFGRSVEYIESGPMAGGFAIFTRKADR